MYVYVCAYVCMYVCKRRCRCRWRCIDVYVYVYVYVYVCACRLKKQELVVKAAFTRFQVLLTRDPALRVSADAALKEEWITNQVEMRLRCMILTVGL